MYYASPKMLESGLRVVEWLIYSACACVAYFCAFSSPSLPLQAFGGRPRAIASDTADQTAARLDPSEDVWKRHLRQTLIEPPPKETPKPSPPPPPLAIPVPRLLATFVEDGRAWGLFVDEKGAQRVCAAGQHVGDFEVVSFTPGIAMLRRESQEYQVKVPSRAIKTTSTLRGRSRS